jgi:hypothetical protein
MKPKITDVSIDRNGRITMTIKLLDRMFQTLRLDDIEIETNSTVEYIDNDERNAVPFKVKGSERTTGTIRFTSRKVTISNRRPLKKV